MTFPTTADLVFYQGRRRPSWASQIEKLKLQQVSIDQVVNAHAGTPLGCTETHNMCVFASGWQRRGEPLVVKLRELAYEGPNPKKRMALAIKWLRRIQSS